MARFFEKVPIAAKIFGLASIMLALLLAVAFLTYRGVDRVDDLLAHVAEVVLPISSRLAEVDRQVLEQEVHIGRLLTAWESSEPSAELIEAELEHFAKRGRQVDREVETALALAAEGLSLAPGRAAVVACARLQPLLEILENEHQEFQDLAERVFELHREGRREDALRLEQRLQQEEDGFDRLMARTLQEVAASTAESARAAAEGQARVVSVATVLAGLAAVLGLALALVVTRGMVRPVKELVGVTREVRAGNLDVEVAVASRDEIGILAETFGAMVAGIREKEQIQATFGQYLDPRIVAGLLAGGERPSEAGEKQVMTVFFSDVAGFSHISETLTPSGLVTLINRYLDLACEPILRRSGVIDQFIGDAVVAFWGPPFAGADEHARLACWAALDQLDQLARLRRQMPDLMGFRKGLPEVAARIGLATGEVVAGSIGSAQSKSYTVIGDAPAVAEHLEGANKQFGTTILITDETRRLAGSSVETREIALVELPGEVAPQPIFELLGRGGELAGEARELKETFESGLAAYRGGDWTRAAERFEACLEVAPGDGPARAYLGRLAALRGRPPAADCTGLWRPEP